MTLNRRDKMGVAVLVLLFLVMLTLLYSLTRSSGGRNAATFGESALIEQRMNNLQKGR